MRISLFKDKEASLLDKFDAKQREKTIAFLKGQFALSEYDCDDIYQDSFLTLYENIKSGKLKELTCSVTTYFTSICKNKAMEFLRKNGKQASLDYDIPEICDHTFLDDKIESILSLDAEDKSIIEKKEELVRNIVRNLSAPCDDILWGYYRDGYSLKALAEKYDYASESSAKVTKHRCCEKFRVRYNELVKSLF